MLCLPIGWYKWGLVHVVAFLNVREANVKIKLTLFNGLMTVVQ